MLQIYFMHFIVYVRSRNKKHSVLPGVYIVTSILKDQATEVIPAAPHDGLPRLLNQPSNRCRMSCALTRETETSQTVR